MPDASPTSPPSLREAFVFGWERAHKHLKPFMALYALALIPFTALNAFLEFFLQGANVYEALPYRIAFQCAAAPLFFIGPTKAVLKAAGDPEYSPSPARFFEFSATEYLRIAAVSLPFAIFEGFSPIIPFPFSFLDVYLLMFPWLYVLDRGENAVQATWKNFTLVFNNPLLVVPLGAAYFLFSLSGALFFLVGIFFTAPAAELALVFVFRKLDPPKA